MTENTWKTHLYAIQSEVDQRLAEYYDQRIVSAENLHADYADLWRAMRHMGAKGGKRLRPYVMLVAYEGLGGGDYEGAMSVAVAFELLHASMLIHDDIIDRDYVRYGRPNVAGQYRERYASKGVDEKHINHYADAAALLAGDLALSGAYELIMNSSLPADTKVAAAQRLHQAIFTVAAGELLDTEAVLLPFESVDTLVIADLKTASYSFVNTLLMAAVLVDAPQEVREALEGIGRPLGIAYQLADDVLGLFGNEAETGKSSTSDIDEGKRTYLMQRTLALCSRPEREYVQCVLGCGRVTARQTEEIRRIVRDSGALAETRAHISLCIQEAEDALDRVPLKGPALSELRELMRYLIERRS